MHIKTIDLHKIRINNDFSVQSQVEDFLEKQIRPFLYHKNMKICLIVGKGLNSKKMIEGKNPVRFYTENFLNNLGFNWQNENSFWGDSGIIWVDL